MENPKTALLMDFAGDDRRLLAIRLEGLGFNVFEAETLAQAQGLLARESVELVVAEWALAAGSDEAFLRTLGPDQRPVFLFTDGAIPDLPLFLARTGVRDVVSKKNRSELLQRIQRMEAPDPQAVLKSYFSGRHILLVEDSATVRHFMRRAVEAGNPGWSVSEAGNGLQALAEMGRRAPDLAVIDMDLAEKDGPAIVRLMREKPQLKLKPVLALAACGRRDLREAFKTDPHVTFLPKPVTAGQIVEAIQAVLGVDRAPAGV